MTRFRAGAVHGLRHGRRSPDTATLGRLLALTERGLIELDEAAAKRDREQGDVS